MRHRHYYGPSGPADIRVLRWLVPYLLKRPKRVVLALICLVFAKGANVMIPLLLKYVIDELEQAKTLSTEQVLLAIPVFLIICYGLFRFLAVFFGELRDAFFSRVAEGTLTEIGLKIFGHLHRLDLEYHLTRKTGGISRDIERGTSAISFLLRSIVFSVVPILLEVSLVTVILLVAFDYRIAGIALFSIVTYISFSVVLTHWRTKFVRKANEIDSQANTRAIDSLLNYETVKYFNNEAFEADHYSKKLLEREDAKVKNHLSLATLNTVQIAIISVAMTAMLWLAAQDVVADKLTLGDFAMLNAYMIQVFIPLNIMGFIYREMKRALADFEAMFKILDIKPKIEDSPNAIAFETEEESIVLESVDFAYHAERPILKQVSLVVPSRKRVAIVGHSGSGKSTIARLLYRFYDPNGGVIKIGGQDIRNYQLDDLRRAIGIVPQDTVLFNDTIYNNIAYGRPGATEEQINEAIDMAYLRGFIDSLPEGVNTVVGERGLKVSGGEKQRIAIARTILKRPKILIFDEATSSLDSASEQAIMVAIDQLAAQHTTIIVAHRLSTIQNADMIIVLDDGVVVEQGDHHALLAEQSYYYNLWSLQQSVDAAS